MSGSGTFRTWWTGLTMSVLKGKADLVAAGLRLYGRPTNSLRHGF
jgi:hypothetical protein